LTPRSEPCKDSGEAEQNWNQDENTHIPADGGRLSGFADDNTARAFFQEANALWQTAKQGKKEVT
jgi:hypothetical protein